MMELKEGGVAVVVGGNGNMHVGFTNDIVVGPVCSGPYTRQALAGAGSPQGDVPEEP